ncbi:MAG: NAD-dependent epimerase/dehydratase family protein [Candidatus Binatia bacterium]
MEKKLALVTGASGFTGGHLCRRLVSAGHRVRALIRDPRLAGELRRQGIETAQGDLRDPRSLEGALDSVEVVYHIAAAYRQGSLSRAELFAINVEGTKHLLDVAIRAGVRRFIHCSTIGVHGSVTNTPANEQSPYAPGDDYQESKMRAEKLVLEYMAGGRMPIVIFRPVGIYGPGDLRFLKLFKAIQTKRFVMLGSGEVLYHLIYIDDLIDGIVLCATEDRAVGNVYILAGKQPVKLNQLVQVIAEHLGVRPTRLRLPLTPVYVAGWICEMICKPFGINPPLYRRRVDFFRKTRSFDISKARAELGFEPRTDLQTGVALTAAWYRKNRLLSQAVAGSTIAFVANLNRGVDQYSEVFAVMGLISG